MPRRALVLLACLGLAAGCSQDPDREPFPEGAAERIERPRTDVPLGTTFTWATAGDDEELRTLVAKVFDSVTTENGLKWLFVQPERGEYEFSGSDAFVDWAGEAGLAVRGHTLVWHQQVPGWLGESDWEAPELEAVLREHVRTVVGRYRGRIGTWDVVNEPFTNRGTWRTADGFPFVEVLGGRYAELALHAAREADPGARLFVNEIGAESGGPKLEALLDLARDYRRRGVPLDGIGLEAHLTTRRPPSREELERTMRRIAGLGLDVEITELDVSAPDGDLERQARVYGDVGAACAAVAACRRVTVWGVSDRDSWIGAEKRPLPFDADVRPKPAWDALTRALRR